MKVLVTESKVLNYPAVSLDVRPLQVVQEPLAPFNHLQQAAPTVMIFGVLLEVIVEIKNPLGEDCYLHPARTGVSIVTAVFGNRRCLLKSHVVYSRAIPFVRPIL